ncbi:alpha/beta hydrolase, partial [Lactococcus lactis]|uniref:lipase family protein n=1 Tax=Lactococcus lactis TaxID=1358 RepID=UPI0024188166
MSNLENFNNIYANLAESAYNGRPKNFPPYAEKKTETPFNYSESASNKKGEVQVRGGTNLPNDGVVYLQPDKTVHIEKVRTNLQVPNPNGGYHTDSYVTNTYQKGLLTDEQAGFNAYFVTDTPKLNKDTKETYMAVRGSDSFGIDTLNDWVGNDGNFALTNAYIPQAKLANQGLISKIKEIKEQAPEAKLNVTGHSLGTIVSAQAVAKLYQEHPKAFDTIGQVVLFDGPDVTQSLKKMGLS